VSPRPLGCGVEELLLEQVETRPDGTVVVVDFELDVVKLNAEYLQGLPFQLKKASVAEMSFKLSYQSLMSNESKRLQIRGVNVILEPTSVGTIPIYGSKKKASAAASTAGGAPPVALGADDNEEAEYGFTFVAHWIEVVKAQLQAGIEGITVTVLGPPADPVRRRGVGGRGSGIRITLPPVTYYNTRPDQLNQATAAALSTSLSRDISNESVAMSSLYSLGQRKLVKVEGPIEVALIEYRIEDVGDGLAILSSVPIVTTSNDITINIRKIQRHLATNVEVDVAVPSISVSLDLNEESLGHILRIGQCYSQAGAPTTPKGGHDHSSSISDALQSILTLDPTVGAILWMEKKLADGGDSAPSSVHANRDRDDLGKVLGLLKQYQATRQQLESTGGLAFTFKAEADEANVSGMGKAAARVDIDDDDVDFPSDGDGDEDDHSSIGSVGSSTNDEDFFDAVEGRPASKHRVCFKGSAAGGRSRGMLQSSYGMLTSHHDARAARPLSLQASATDPAPDVTDSLNKGPQSRMEIRVLIEAVGVDVRGPDAATICLSGSNVVIDVKGLGSAITTASITGTTLSLHERNCRGELQPWLTCYALEDPRRVSAGPQLDLDITMRSTGDPMIRIAARIQPMIVSIHIDRAMVWKDTVDRLLARLGMQSEASPMSMSIRLVIPSIDLVLHSHPSHSRDHWLDLQAALGINSLPCSRWDSMVDRVPALADHLGASRGGVRIELSDLLFDTGSSSHGHPQDPQLDPTFSSSSYQRGHAGQVGMPEFRPGQSVKMKSASAYVFFAASNVRGLSGFDEDTVHVQTLILRAGGARGNYGQVVEIGLLLDSTIPLRPAQQQKLGKMVSSRGSTSSAGAFAEVDGTDDEDRDLLMPPQLDPLQILHLVASDVAVNLRQREYTALVAIAKSLGPASNGLPTDVPLSGSGASGRGTEPKVGFGLVLHSKVTTMQISENDRGPDGKDVGRAGLDSSMAASEPFCLCVAALEPRIEMFTSGAETFFSIQSDDASLFEMTHDQARDLHRRDGHSGSCQAARCGPQAHCVPFLHRTSLTSRSGYWDNDHFGEPSTRATVASRPPTFRLQLMLTEEPSYSRLDDTMVYTIAVHMALHDITFRYEPTSSWISKLIALLTPESPQQILQKRNRNTSGSEVRSLAPCLAAGGRRHTNTANTSLDNCNEASTFEASTFEASNSLASLGCNSALCDLSVGHGSPSPPSVTIPFEITKISIRARKCLIDYCCEETPSRVILSVGLIRLSSTLVSNSPRVGLKFQVRDVGLYLSNRLMRNDELEQSPLNMLAHRDAPVAGAPIDFDQFLDVHAFVQLFTVDHVELMVTLHGDNRVPLSVQMNIGLCCIYACMDTLDVLSVSAQPYLFLHNARVLAE
jgi:hypothetical protein